MANQYSRSLPTVQLFKMLGDSTRLRLIVELFHGDQNVTQLCRKLKAAQPTASHHLGLLRMAGIVTTRRSGKEIFYSIHREKIQLKRILGEIIQKAGQLTK